MNNKKAIEFLKKSGFPLDSLKSKTPQSKRIPHTDRQEYRAFFKKHKKLFKKTVDERRYKASLLHWEEKKTHEEIAKLFGVSRARVGQLIYHALDLVKEALQGN